MNFCKVPIQRLGSRFTCCCLHWGQRGKQKHVLFRLTRKFLGQANLAEILLSAPARLILKSFRERCKPKENAKFSFMTLPCKFWCRRVLAKPVWRRMLPVWSMRLPRPVQPPAGGSHQTNNIVPALGKTRGSVVFAHTKRETCQQENEPRKSDSAYLLGAPLKLPASAKGSMESPS